ncbi:hypothetical protein [Phosphitispora sp. TUW77]|uniref:hypothetical protein n=1 Tax=Phosphitispora sp. TUW77 TaxID=3152361 RepID=UPI003AB1EEA4
MKRFAFINHSIDIDEFKMNYPAIRLLPGILINKLLKHSSLFKSAELEIRFDNITCKGWNIFCPLTEKEITGLPKKKHLKRIVQTIKAAEKLGAEVVGLGGSLPAVPGLKETIMAEGFKICITFGHNYSIFAAVEGVKLAAAARGYDMDQVTVAVLGATGYTGSVCAAILASEVKNLVLAGDNQVKLRQMTNRILYDTGLPVKTVQSVKQVLNMSDIVFIDVSSIGLEIRREDFKTGAVICFLRGEGISIEDLTILKILQNMVVLRNDLKFIDGGLVEIPGISELAIDFRLPSGLVYPWMAETLILTLGKNRYSILVDSLVDVKKVDALKEMAKSYGFGVRGYLEVCAANHHRHVRRESVVNRVTDHLRY